MESAIQGQDLTISQAAPAETQSAPASMQDTSNGTQVSQAAPTSEEKTFKQSFVNKLVGSAKQEAFERGRVEALEEAKRQYAQQQSSASAPQASATGMGGMSASTPEQIEQLVNDKVNAKINEHTEKAIAQKVANEFIQKLQTGREKYEDFDEVVQQLNLPSIPHIVQWVHGLDNTADVVYDLAKNANKLSNVLMLAGSGLPHLAQRELMKLSDSIKQNQAAIQNAKSVAEPLSQIQPSTVGTDNGTYSVADYKNADWLRA